MNLYKDIIKNAEFIENDNLKIDLKLKIEETKLDKITSNNINFINIQKGKKLNNENFLYILKKVQLIMILF